jgi:hypothetical protein
MARDELADKAAWAFRLCKNGARLGGFWGGNWQGRAFCAALGCCGKHVKVVCPARNPLIFLLKRILSSGR